MNKMITVLSTIFTLVGGQALAAESCAKSTLTCRAAYDTVTSGELNGPQASAAYAWSNDGEGKVGCSAVLKLVDPVTQLSLLADAEESGVSLLIGEKQESVVSATAGLDSKIEITYVPKNSSLVVNGQSLAVARVIYTCTLQ